MTQSSDIQELALLLTSTQSPTTQSELLTDWVKRNGLDARDFGAAQATFAARARVKTAEGRAGKQKQVAERAQDKNQTRPLPQTKQSPASKAYRTPYYAAKNKVYSSVLTCETCTKPIAYQTPFFRWDPEQSKEYRYFHGHNDCLPTLELPAGEVHPFLQCSPRDKDDRDAYQRHVIGTLGPCSTSYDLLPAPKTDWRLS